MLWHVKPQSTYPKLALRSAVYKRNDCASQPIIRLILPSEVAMEIIIMSLVGTAWLLAIIQYDRH